ncbi:MAG: hypothetical protein U0Y08_01050 [Bacteroidia bacterium]
MKNRLLTTFSAFAVLLLFNSCSKNPTAFSFSHDYVATTFTVQPTTTAGDIVFTSEEIETDIQGLVADNGVSIDNLNSIKVKSVTLTIIDSNSTPYTFDLVSKVESKIGRTTDGTLIKFAGKDPVPASALTSLGLDVNDIELLDYFGKTKIKFELNGHTNAAIDHAFQIKVEMTVGFEGEVIK